MSVFDPNLIHPKSPHHLSYGGLNRNDMARRDSGLIKRLMAQFDTRYIIVWRGLNLFKSDITGLKSMRWLTICLLYTSPSPRDAQLSRMPSSA